MAAHPKRMTRTRGKGATLPLVMIAAVLLFVTGVALLALDLQARTSAARTSNEIASRVCADAGLEKAIYMMNKKLQSASWTDSNLPSATGEQLPGCAGVFTYGVKKNSDGDYFVASIGASSQARKVVTATLERTSLFEHAILTKQRLHFLSAGRVTGYNSKDPADTDVDVSLGTVSTLENMIPIGPGVVIEGDVFAGVDAEVDKVIGPGGTVLGKKYALKAEPHFPALKIPPLPNKGAPLNVTGATLQIDPDDSGCYTGITLLTKGSSKGMLEVVGGDVVLHIAGNVILGPKCELVVNTDASLQLFVDGSILCGNAASISQQTPGAKPENLMIIGTSDHIQPFSLKAKNDWCGVVYAPNANIEVNAQGDIRGAIICNDILVRNGGTFYYDEALKDSSLGGLGARFVVKRWSER